MANVVHERRARVPGVNDDTMSVSEKNVLARLANVVHERRGRGPGVNDDTIDSQQGNPSFDTHFLSGLFCLFLIFFIVSTYKMAASPSESKSATGCAHASPVIPNAAFKIKRAGI